MNTETILTALRAEYENIETIDGAEWGIVYLDNTRPDGCNRHQFAGFLSALEAQGLYRSFDGEPDFGMVKI